MPFRPDPQISKSGFRPDLSTPPKTPGTTGERNKFMDLAPVGTTIGGTMAGPVGSTLGYAAGKYGTAAANQLPYLADIVSELIGKSSGAKLTPYAEREYNKLGIGAEQKITPEMINTLRGKGETLSKEPKFSYKQAMMREAERNVPSLAKESLKITGGALATGVADVLITKAVGLVLNKLLPKVDPRFAVKGVLPKTIAKSARSEAAKVYQPVKEAVESAGMERNIPVDDIIKKLNVVEEDIVKSVKDLPYEKWTPGTQDQFDAIKVVKDTVMRGAVDGKVNLGQMDELAKEFGSGVFTPTGHPKMTSDPFMKEIISGSKVAGKEASAIRLNRLVSGSENKAKATKTFTKALKDYGKLKNLAQTLERNPTAGAFPAGMVAQTASNLGVPGGGPLSAAIFAALMPYGQHALRGLVKLPFQAMPTATRAGIPMLLEKFLKTKREK